MRLPSKLTYISKKKRFEILARDHFTCVYCGRKAPDVALHVDHVLPIKMGGSNDDSNLATACFDCNSGKKARLFPATSGRSFRGWLRTQVGRDDAIGDLADDEARTPINGDPGSLREFFALLREVGSLDRDVAWAAWQAWREFRRGGRMTRAIVEHHNEQDLMIRQRRGACIWLKSGLVMDGVFHPKGGGDPKWVGDGEPPAEVIADYGKIKKGYLPRR